MPVNSLRVPTSPLAPAPHPTRHAAHRPRAVVIGASTGGPQALSILLPDLVPVLPQLPVLVVLHMPIEFTSFIAEHASKITGFPARVARHGETVEAGHIYFAPGNRHLCLERNERNERNVRLKHCDEPAENFCKPAVDVLFRTAAACYGADLLGIVLTGMGHDGLAGARAIVGGGGSVIVQDAATSVIWGMPGSVAGEGLAEAVLPLAAIGAAVRKLCASPYKQKAAQ